MRDCALADADVVESFFAPANTDALDSLMAQYSLARRRIAEVAAFTGGETASSVLHYFLEGNASEDRGRHSLSLSAAQLFTEAGAVAALNSAYWSKALALTDVVDMMPQARRTEWHEQIRSHKCPEFEESTVRATLVDLLAMRAQFLGERVDGIFRGLSGEHVTNAPEAFGKRMIVARVLTCYDTADSSTCGIINDLRCVIARFMGRDEPTYQSTDPLIRSLRGRWGEWVTVDGGALRIRLYKKGTAHIEVHPDMAWRLNATLASLYPLAIPPQFRQRPKRRLKDIPAMQRPLPSRVVELLAGMGPARVKVLYDGWRERFDAVPRTLQFRYGVDDSSDAAREAAAVLCAIGGTCDKGGTWTFDYEPADVVMEIVTSGCIPDRVAHQFYPTPERLARLCVEMAQIGDSHRVLEPSAGQGDIAALLPVDRTTCVEISPLHCAILRARGLPTVQADFLAWTDAPFDRVVMNPPFADGRARAHVEHAASLLKPGGRLVAVLPASMRGKDLLPGHACEWSAVFDGEFRGTSVSVVLLAAERPTP